MTKNVEDGAVSRGYIGSSQRTLIDVVKDDRVKVTEEDARVG